MDTPWKISLLGVPCLRQGDDVVVRFATSRAAALLGRLALLPRRTHPREELADLLWPDADPTEGRNRLRVTLASLRRQLEPPGVPRGGVLIAERTSLRLNPVAFRCDVGEFETALTAAERARSGRDRRAALARAIGLYAGELLPGFYDEWIIEERERLTALYENACQEWRALPAAEPLPPDTAPLPPPDAPQETLRLPLPFTRFFGRERETTALARALSDPAHRLITLTGPGGVGKTRLAVETARRTAHAFGGPVGFVPLADLTDAALLPAAVAAALCLPPSGAEAIGARIASVLAGSRALLLLDNLEHLGDDGALQVRALLDGAPGLTCLVTSRRRLGLEGERAFPVAPLPTPADPEAPAGLAASPSVRLFVDRAQAVRPDFEVTVGNAAAVAAVCRDLEGLPLALELAAAHSGALTPGKMREQLAERLDFLSSRQRDRPLRHRSMRAVLEWGEQQLAPELAQFFHPLCVFRGGWTLEAAGAVCGTPSAGRLLDLTERLRDQSLLTAEDAGEEMRFRMLETVREFGAERLSPDERRALSQRHAEYFAAVAARMGALWYGPEQPQAQATLDAERDNLRAALAFCRDRSPDPAWDGGGTALRLAGWLGEYWITGGQMQEGRDWLASALAGTGPSADRARALTADGHLAAGQGLYDEARTALTESLEISRALGDRTAAARALSRRGVASLWRRDNAQAAVDLAEALALSRELGNDTLTANVLVNLGNLAHQWREDDAEAGALYAEALLLFRAVGDRQRASYCLYNLGSIAHDAGEADRADTLVRESMALADSVGDVWQRAYCLLLAGELSSGRDDLDAARTTLEEGRDLFRRVGDRRMEADILCSLAAVARRQADPGRAEAALEAALALRRALHDTAGVAECRIDLAETAASQGRWADVRRHLQAIDPQDIPNASPLRARFDTIQQSARDSP